MLCIRQHNEGGSRTIDRVCGGCTHNVGGSSAALKKVAYRRTGRSGGAEVVLATLPKTE